MKSKELLGYLRPNNTNTYNAQLTENGLNCNLSSLFTHLIKDAARCNSYSCDVYFEMRAIENICNNFDPEKIPDPIWIGFRKLGVDCTYDIFHRLNNEPMYGTLSQNYFMLYRITFEKECDNFYKVVVNEYYV